MDKMKQKLLASFDAVPRLILRKILIRKVSEAGIDMPLEAIDAMTEHILAKKEEKFVWNDGTDDDHLDFSLTFTDEDAQEIEAAIAKVVTAIPDAVMGALEAAGDSIFESLRERWEIEYLAQQYELEGFQDRLEEQWGEGLAYLRMLLTCCREIGRNTSTRHARSKSKRYLYRRWVLVRLHTRACQVADEIICLMGNGFADGAMARWRTLHELSVVATLIAGGDEELAERYILHDAVEVKRQADNYDATQVELGFPPIKKKPREAIDQKFKSAIDRFGPEFAHPYGWAAKHLNHRRPTFKELQIAADRAAMSSYYKLASFNVHAGARSLFFNLSTMGDQDILIAGRSNAGLLDPGSRVPHTLVLITSLYAGSTKDFERLAELKGLLRLRDAVVPAFERADRRLRRKIRSMQRPPKKATT